jgi:hypothetical protein
VGCEARKLPAEEEVFFLDFYLYRTSQDQGVSNGWDEFCGNAGFHYET